MHKITCTETCPLSGSANIEFLNEKRKGQVRIKILLVPLYYNLIPFAFAMSSAEFNSSLKYFNLKSSIVKI